MSYTPNPKYGPLPPWQIDKDRFHELLNVLPPGRHSCYHTQESFFLIERLSGNIVMWVVRVGAERGPGPLRALGGRDPLYFAFHAPADLSLADLQRTIQTALEQHDKGSLPQSLEAALETAK